MVVRVIDVRIIVGRSVVNLICVYVPHTGKQMEEKEKFFTQYMEGYIRYRIIQ